LPTPIIQVPHDRLLDHPLNAHRTTSKERNRLKNNIRRSGRYPALVAYELTESSAHYPGEPGYYQILDGHQRKIILRELYEEEGLAEFELVTLEDWSPLTDEEALLLLATLNTWGDNVPRKRAELLHAITKFTSESDAANILPETRGEIKDAMRLLEQPVDDIRRIVEELQKDDTVEMSFVVGTDQEATLARMTASLQVLAAMWGAELKNVQINRNKKTRRIAVCTFQVAVADKAIVENAVKRAIEDVGHAGRNKRGYALVTIAQHYLATVTDEQPAQQALEQVTQEVQAEPEK